MKSFREWFYNNYKVKLPKEINEQWFKKYDLPLVVECACCGMTLPLPATYIDEEGFTFCSSCAN